MSKKGYRKITFYLPLELKNIYKGILYTKGSNITDDLVDYVTRYVNEHEEKNRASKGDKHTR